VGLLTATGRTGNGTQPYRMGAPMPSGYPGSATVGAGADLGIAQQLVTYR